MPSNCPHDPSQKEGGMYHCPECGEMVVAGLSHPDYDNIDWSLLDKLEAKLRKEDNA